jgi:hypothetical protein
MMLCVITGPWFASLDIPAQLEIHMFKTLGIIGAVVTFSMVIIVCGDEAILDGTEPPGATEYGKSDHAGPELPVWRKRYHDYYLDTVQPILDRRCVTCHSCYNAPCQLKLSSYDGVSRGATKKEIYETRLIKAMEPTRLYVDARTAQEWHKKKGFFPVVHHYTDNAALNIKKSLLYKILTRGQEHKQKNPFVFGQATAFDGVASESRNCARDDKELDRYFKDNPDQGMPFGCPEIGKKDYETIVEWIEKGAPGPSPEARQALETPSTGAAGLAVLERWEDFFNGPSAKERLTARYLYEHLFLAELYFDSIPHDYYRLVRSRTRHGTIDEIATVLPYDDPKTGAFYYRLQKITSTIMHKTHTVYRLDDARMKRYRKLFLEPDWGVGTVQLPSYDNKVASNPFVAFAQIPAEARYRFLLDDVHYTILTFINGPVCRGQSALNVIRDHFLALFLDPKSDLSVTDPQFLADAAQKLELPITGRDNPFKNTYPSYKLKQRSYVSLRDKYYAKRYPQGHSLDDIWDGDANKNAVVTVYRHFDSGAAFEGVVGNVPKTVLLLDYPVLERIHYNLVAGFNVFGTVSHQLSVRAYMDGLRVEAEDNFLNLLPRDRRAAIRDSWYEGFPAQVKMTIENKLVGGDRPTQIGFDAAKDPVQDLLEQVLGSRLSPLSRGEPDPINPFVLPGPRSAVIDPIASQADLERELSKLSGRHGEFIHPLPDVAFLRVTRPNQPGLAYTIVRNRAHQNVSFILLENFFVDPKHDTLHVMRGFAGSYPNFFFVVRLDEAREFLQRMLALRDGDGSFAGFVTRFGVRRGDPRLWTTLDWFHDKFYTDDPIRAGLFDINRYENF